MICVTIYYVMMTTVTVIVECISLPALFSSTTYYAPIVVLINRKISEIQNVIVLFKNVIQ